MGRFNRLVTSLSLSAWLSLVGVAKCKCAVNMLGNLRLIGILLTYNSEYKEN